MTDLCKWDRLLHLILYTLDPKPRERGGAVVRALAFYTNAPGSIPSKGKNQDIGRSPVDPTVNKYLVL